MSFYLESRDNKHFLVERDYAGNEIASIELAPDIYKHLGADVHRSEVSAGEPAADELRFDRQDFECLAWKGSPLFQQVVAAVKRAKKKKVIGSEKKCKKLANKTAKFSRTIGLPNIIGKSMGKCACKTAF